MLFSFLLEFLANCCIYLCFPIPCVKDHQPSQSNFCSLLVTMVRSTTAIGQMLRKLCEYKGIEIIEAEAYKDHIHMVISIPPKYSVAQIMRYLKGKSSLMIYEKYANLKYKYGNRHFWRRGYYVSTIGRNRRAVEQYIQNQV